jgi:hypothetical protein
MKPNPRTENRKLTTGNQRTGFFIRKKTIFYNAEAGRYITFAAEMTPMDTRSTPIPTQQ